MKTILITVSMVLSVSVFSAPRVTEYDETQEVKCSEEASRLGCHGKTDEAILGCVEKVKKSLSPECRRIHEGQFQNKR